MFVFTGWGCDKKWMMNLYSNTPLIIPTGFKSKVTATGAHATNIWQTQVDWVQYFFIYLFIFFGGGGRGSCGCAVQVMFLKELLRYLLVCGSAGLFVCLFASPITQKVMNDCHEIFWRGPRPRPRRSALFFQGCCFVFLFLVVVVIFFSFSSFSLCVCVCVCVCVGGGGGGLNLILTYLMLL